MHLQYVFQMCTSCMWLFCFCDACHMLHVRIDISNKDALVAWNAAKTNPDLYQTGEGPNKRVAVHGIPTIEGVRSKAFSRMVGQECELGTHSLVDAARARLDFVAQGVDLGHDFGGMGDAFRVGAAVGNTSVMGPLADAPVTPAVTTAQISSMSLTERASAASPATPTTSGGQSASAAMATSPRTARIGTLCVIFPLFWCLRVQFLGWVCMPVFTQSLGCSVFSLDAVA